MAKDLKGSGGKGGGAGSTFKESENSLRANVIVNTVEAIGEGPMVGPVKGAQSIFLNSTALQQTDLSLNFGGQVAWTFRNGTPDQDPVPGFEYQGAPVEVNTQVTNASAVTYTVTDPAITSVGVTLSLPEGLYNQNTTNSSLEPTRVDLAIDVKLTASGTWGLARNITYEDKTTSPYQETFKIDRPFGSGGWDIRVRRITADNAASTLRNNTYLAYVTELQSIPDLTYPDVAYFGLQIDAKSVNSSSIPVRSFEVFGLIIQVPSNLNPVTRAFTGVWDGEFQYAWSDDPAWVLYDICTNTRYGLGLSEDMVDRYSFYDASVYNSELIPFTNTEAEEILTPRFSFNYQIAEGQQGPELLQRIASVMNAKVMWVGGQITVLQDRPTEFSHVFTKSNVIGGFKLVGSSRQQRSTVCNVTWNDPLTRYQQRVTSVEDTAGITRYGYNVASTAAYGCTNEPQAIRFGRWFLDTVLNQTETITFSTGLEGQLVLPHEVIKVYDTSYTGQSAAGRLKSGSTTTSIKLDTEITLIGDSLIDIALPDGTIYASVTVTSTGVTDTLTVSPALPSAPPEYSSFILKTNDVEGRLFRVSKVSEKERGVYQIEAGVYDPNKYARVEAGVSFTPPVFSSITETVSGPPTNLVFAERVTYLDNKVTRNVTVSWQAPETVVVITEYRVRTRIQGSPVQVSSVSTTSFELLDVPQGELEVTVQAVSFTGVLSRVLQGTYTVNAIENDGSILSAPTGLAVLGGGTTWTGEAMSIQFTNPTVNGTLATSVMDFKIEVWKAGVKLRTEYVPGVPPGSSQTWTYTYAANLADGLKRSFLVKVFARDGNRKLSLPVEATLSNPVPGALVNFQVIPGIGSIMVKYDKPLDTDFKGVLVWRGTSAGFTPSSGNLIADQSGNLVIENGLTALTTYYYKAGAYDTFDRPTDGTGLNLVSGSGTPLSSAGIPSGSSNPGTGTAGDLFFNTTNGQLYRYHGGAWTVAVPAVNVTGTLTNAQIADVAATKLTGQITTTQITDNAITSAKVNAGAITAGKIAAGSIVAADIASGTITATQIASDTITANQIATNAITSNELAANAVIAGKILAGAVSTNELAANAVTAAKIAANTITAGQIASGTVTATQMATGTITAGSAILADAAVTTLKIAGNAVTVPTYGELGTQVACGYGETKDVLSVTVDTGGQPVFVVYNLHSFLYISPSDGMNQSLIARVYINGVLKATHSYGNISEFYPRQVKLGSVYSASPGSGSFNILITLQNSTSTSTSGLVWLDNATAGQPATSIFAIGVKR